MSEAITHTLKVPIEKVFAAGTDGERVEIVTQLTMRTDIEAGDLLATDEHEGEIAKSIAMIAQLTGESFAAIKRLKKDDFGFFVERLTGL